MFIPTTTDELKKLSWDGLDVILVTGDTYIDSPFIGISVIGKVLLNAGYRVGIIAQPDWQSGRDITRLGEPRLFWGVTAGSVDSMVANYTPVKMPRRQDDYTPGGRNTKRPDRASIVYTNLIRRFFKNTRPVVLGGIEASLRRLPHYDYWDDGIRRSILFDAKADYLVYGMGEKAILELAHKLKNGEPVEKIRGLCYIAGQPRPGYLHLPSYPEVKADKQIFIEMFHTFYQHNDPLTAKGLCQLQDTRCLIHNPPAPYPNESELSAIYDLDYERDAHPFYKKDGPVKALETIRFSITSHLGCFGECNFCGISVHQGRTVRSRSEASILKEARLLSRLPDFKGYILDVGGPTANMFGMECENQLKLGSCRSKSCLFPKVCRNRKVSHARPIRLLKKLGEIPGVKKAFVASGIRYDLVLADEIAGTAYLREIVENHVSGQLKVAPEHSEDKVLNLMRKPGTKPLEDFKNLFDRLNREARKKQFLTYYLIAAHPGCEREDMIKLKKFVTQKLELTPEQVQIFTPLPSTYSALMYYTGMDPWTREPVFVEKDPRRKEEQKRIITVSG
ncbi:MAG: YgiQ family radical SAM protein [Proteobacteria bacterium]|nr:YgiQ family radical SAM protein [Pseudomonadota bacterium]